MTQLVDAYPWLVPVVLFPLLWTAIVFGLAHAGGWARLAREYRHWDPPEGDRWFGQSAAFGWVSYNQCLIVGAGSRGLRFSVFFPFRVEHPPLLIPWNEITATPGKRLFIEHVDLRFRRAPEIRVRISQRLASAMYADGYRWTTVETP